MIQIRIHQFSPQLDEWLILNRCTTWAFVTAWNPIDKAPHQLGDNVENNQVLLETLQQSGWIILPAWGIPDTQIWPPEASFLVLGISKEDAKLIARQFNQHAFVFGEYKNRSELCQLSNQLNDNFHATTYSTAPLDLHHGKSFEMWLTCLEARCLQFSNLPRLDCIFQQPYHGGYLCWLKE